MLFAGLILELILRCRPCLTVRAVENGRTLLLPRDPPMSWPPVQLAGDMRMLKSTIRAPRRAAAIAVVVSVATLVACSQQGTAEAPADLIVVNGKVYPAIAGGELADMVAVRGNTIVRVGSN